MKKLSILLIALTAIALFSGCANSIPVQECISESPYGFWGGLWHGIILPFSFIGSLFSDDIAIYAINNTGGWYDFGFFWGLGMAIGGGSRASK